MFDISFFIQDDGLRFGGMNSYGWRTLRLQERARWAEMGNQWMVSILIGTVVVVSLIVANKIKEH